MPEFGEHELTARIKKIIINVSNYSILTILIYSTFFLPSSVLLQAIFYILQFGFISSF